MLNYNSSTEEFNNTTIGGTSPIIYYLVSAIIIDILVVIANAIELRLLIVKWSGPSRFSHNDQLLMSLCLCDLLSGFGLFALDFWYLRQFLDIDLVDMNDFQLLIGESVVFVFVTSSVVHITAISVERLIAVMFPMVYHSTLSTEQRTRRWLHCSMVVIWLGPLLMGIGFFTFKYLTLGQRETTYFRLIIMSTCSLIALSCYMALATALCHQERIKERELYRDLPREMRRAQRDRTTTLTCLFMGVSFFVCVLPYALADMSSFDSKQISNILITIQHLVNPCLYFVKIFIDKRKRSRSDSATTVLLCPATIARPESASTTQA